jgi:oligoendopeptidase F
MFHIHDLYTPLLAEAPVKFSYEEAQAKALEALKPLGEEYLSVIQHIDAIAANTD